MKKKTIKKKIVKNEFYFCDSALLQIVNNLKIRLHSRLYKELSSNIHFK